MKLSPCVCQRLARPLLSALAGAMVCLAISGCAGTGGGMASPDGIRPQSPPAPPPISYQPPVPIPEPAPPPLPAPAPTPRPASGAKILLGIDVLAAQKFSILQGQRVGLLTHPAGVNHEGVSTIDILRRAPGVKLVALFGAEHGIYGNIEASAKVADTIDQRTGLPVYSLYDKTGIPPTPEMLQGIDVMVVDLQDLGTRSYTFISCLRETMKACFEQNKTVVVLDRPNPLGGLKVGGPMLEDQYMSYVGAYPVPYVFGLTIGELARMLKDIPANTPNTPAALKIADDVRQRGRLIVVPMSGWRRSMLWADTGLKWIPTSPNIPTPEAAMGYALTGLGGITGNFGHGVGTPYAFRLLNYPGKKPAELAAILKGLKLSGLDFVPLTYHDPKDPKGEERSGVYVNVTDWNAVQPTKLGFEMMKYSALWSTSGNPFAKLDQRSFCIYVGSTAWWKEITTKGGRADVDGFFRQWEAQDAVYQQASKRWWLYQ